MRRFYLSQRIGNGLMVEEVDQTVGPYRPSGEDYGLVGEYIELGDRFLCWADVSDAQHAMIISDPRTAYIPFEDAGGSPLPVTATLAEISAANRDTIRSWLEARHVPIADLTGSDTIAKLLRRVVQRFRLWCVLGADDVTEALDLQVKDVPVAKRQRINAALQARGYDISFATASMPVRDFLRGLCDQDVVRYGGVDQ